MPACVCPPDGAQTQRLPDWSTVRTVRQRAKAAPRAAAPTGLANCLAWPARRRAKTTFDCLAACWPARGRAKAAPGPDWSNCLVLGLLGGAQKAAPAGPVMHDGCLPAGRPARGRAKAASARLVNCLPAGPVGLPPCPAARKSSARRTGQLVICLPAGLPGGAQKQRLPDWSLACLPGGLPGGAQKQRLPGWSAACLLACLPGGPRKQRLPQPATTAHRRAVATAAAAAWLPLPPPPLPGCHCHRRYCLQLHGGTSTGGPVRGPLSLSQTASAAPSQTQNQTSGRSAGFVRYTWKAL